MDTQQVCTLKRIGTWLAASLMIFSVGLMLLGWTVPRKVAFDAGVFGFQLFPVAILAVLIRIALPLVLNTWIGHTLWQVGSHLLMRITAVYCWFSWRFMSSTPLCSCAAINKEKLKNSDISYYDYQTFFHYPATGRDPMGYPLDRSDSITTPEL